MATSLDFIRAEHDSLRNRVLAQEDGMNKLWAFCAELEKKVQRALDQMRLDIVSKMQAQAFEEINARLADLGTSIRELPSARALHIGLQNLKWLEAGPAEVKDVLIRLEGRLSTVEGQKISMKQVQSAMDETLSSRTKAWVNNDEHERLKQTVIETCTELRYLIESKTEGLGRRFEAILQDKWQGLASQLESKSDRDSELLVAASQRAVAEDLQEKFYDLRRLVESKDELHKRDQAELTDTMSRHCVDAMYAKTMELKSFVEARLEGQRRDIDLLCGAVRKDFEPLLSGTLRRDLEHLSKQASQHSVLCESYKKDLSVMAESLQRSISEQCSEIRQVKADKSALNDFSDSLRESFAELVHDNNQQLRTFILGKESDLRTCISQQCSELREVQADKSDCEKLAKALREELQENCNEIGKAYNSLISEKEAELKTMLMNRTSEKEAELKTLILNRTEFRQESLSQTLTDMVSEAVKVKSTELTFLMESKTAVQKKDFDALAEAFQRKESDFMRTMTDRISEAVQLKSTDLAFSIESKVATQNRNLDSIAEALQQRDTDLTSKLRALGDIRQNLIQTLHDNCAKAIQANAAELMATVESRSNQQKKDVKSMAESLRQTLEDRCSELRSLKADKRDLEACASRKDQERLAEALSQSCQDLSTSILASRREITQLEQNCKDLGHNVVEYREVVATNDAILKDLRRSVFKQSQVVGDLERSRGRAYSSSHDAVTSEVPAHLLPAQQTARSRSSSQKRSPSEKRYVSPGREAKPCACGQEMAPWLPTSPRPPSPTLLRNPQSYRGNLAARLWGNVASPLRQ